MPMHAVWCGVATQRKRVDSTVLLSRTVVLNPKGIRLTHEGAKEPFLKIFRAKPYSAINCLLMSK